MFVLMTRFRNHNEIFFFVCFLNGPVMLQDFYKVSGDLLIELAFNDTLTLVGHFVSSPRERER